MFDSQLIQCFSQESLDLKLRLLLSVFILRNIILHRNVLEMFLSYLLLLKVHTDMAKTPTKQCYSP